VVPRILKNPDIQEALTIFREGKSYLREILENQKRKGGGKTTLVKGDHLIIKRSGEIVTGEAYHEFNVEHVTEAIVIGNEVFYVVLLRKVE